MTRPPPQAGDDGSEGPACAKGARCWASPALPSWRGRAPSSQPNAAQGPPAAWLARGRLLRPVGRDGGQPRRLCPAQPSPAITPGRPRQTTAGRRGGEASSAGACSSEAGLPGKEVPVAAEEEEEEAVAQPALGLPSPGKPGRLQETRRGRDTRLPFSLPAPLRTICASARQRSEPGPNAGSGVGGGCVNGDGGGGRLAGRGTQSSPLRVGKEG